MRIVVATDGSAPASLGVEMAGTFTWPPGTTIRVITAVDSMLFGRPWPGVAGLQATENEPELLASAGRMLDAAAGQLGADGVTVESGVVEGRPETAIVEEAERFGADLIVIGARGHGAIQEALVGSVSAKVLDASPVPVLVARGRAHGRILLAWDGSPAAERAASLLETWPIFRGAAVHVVTVTEADLALWAGTAEAAAPEVIEMSLQAVDDARAERRQIAELMAARLQAVGLTADYEVREGGAGDEIVAAADEWSAELIVLGTHARAGLARLALGSVARNVVHHARTSVLVAQEPAEDRDARQES